MKFPEKDHTLPLSLVIVAMRYMLLSFLEKINEHACQMKANRISFSKSFYLQVTFIRTNRNHTFLTT